MIQRRRHPNRPPADIDHWPVTARLEHLGGVPVAHGIPGKSATIPDPAKVAKHRLWLAKRRGADR
jgi:hypothetical protein